MPAAADRRPALDMPPEKLDPVIAITLPAASSILLALSIRMPWVADMMPLSTIAPVMVLPRMSMPVLAVIVPEFEILPMKVETTLSSMAALPARTAPAFISAI